MWRRRTQTADRRYLLGSGPRYNLAMLTTGRRVALLLLLAGCSEDPGACGSEVCLFKERTPIAVETKLSQTTAMVGMSVGVTCSVRFSDGATEELAPPDVSISATPEATVDGARVSATRPGTYTVSCTIGDAAVTPAELVVTAAFPARSIATVDPSSIAS